MSVVYYTIDNVRDPDGNDGRDGVWAIIHAMPISFRARRGGDD